MDELVYLVGCGGHGKVVLNAALASGLAVTGILDGRLPVGSMVFGIPVLGDDEILDAASNAQWLNGIGANPDLTLRCRMFERFSAHRLVGVRHPSVVGERLGMISAGVQLMAGSVLQPRTEIGDNAVINTGARIDHDCAIGSHAFVGPGAILCGDVRLEGSVFIGAGAIVLPGVTIGEGAIIGAGAVIRGDVARRARIAGNPAQQLGIAEQ